MRNEKGNTECRILNIECRMLKWKTGKLEMKKEKGNTEEW
jgi:hypothetical protein